MKYGTMIASAIGAWVVGLLIDANIGFEPVGVLELRLLLPMLAIGLCILKAIKDSGKKE